VLVPVARKQCADGIVDESNASHNPECPRASHVTDYHWDGEREYYPTDPGARRGDAGCYATLFVEPLTDHPQGTGVEETHPQSETEALGQEEVPDLGRERGCDEGAGLEYYAAGHDFAYRRLAEEDCCQWSDYHGGGKGETAHEGVL